MQSVITLSKHKSTTSSFNEVAYASSRSFKQCLRHLECVKVTLCCWVISLPSMNPKWASRRQEQSLTSYFKIIAVDKERIHKNQCSNQQMKLYYSSWEKKTSFEYGMGLSLSLSLSLNTHACTHCYHIWKQASFEYILCPSNITTANF
jgi:hypothetical protein